MDSSVCLICGREIRRRVYEYEGGARRGSMTFRQYGSWWHADDLSPACTKDEDGDDAGPG